MMEKLEIRSAVRDDLVSLLHLYEQLNPGDSGLDGRLASGIFKRFTESPGNAILLGILNDAIVTSCTLVVIENLTRGGTPYALIENVITDQHFRKRGFGKAILTEAVSRAWEHDCYKVMLLTGSKKPSTIQFYNSVGFEQNKTGFQIRRIPTRAE